METVLPFIITLVAILLTDLLTGILVGLFTSSAFILYGNFNKGVRVYKEKHLHGIVTRIELPSQVTFLNRSALISALEHIHKDQQLIIDATQCDSIDPDIYQVIQDYQNETAVKRQVDLKLIGFKQHYEEVDDAVLDIYISTRDLQRKLSPQQVITLLKEGNERFVKMSVCNVIFIVKFVLPQMKASIQLLPFWDVWTHVLQLK